MKLQDLAIYPITYPAILGQDVAGEVVAVGEDLSGRFKVGSRVMGTTSGFATKRDTEKGFQAYTVLEGVLTSELPDGMEYERAVVLPLGVTTAAAGLFNSDFLGLRLPREPRGEGTGEVLLVWGGASSVGTAAVQLGVAAGYTVFATASPKNFELVRRLGATKVFDYKSEGVVDEIVGAIKGEKFVGAFDAVGGAAWAATIEVVRRLDGGKFIATAVRGFEEPPEGIGMKQIYSLSIRENGVGKAVWEEFLPKALAAGTFVPGLESLVVGKGLESVQSGLDRLKDGVSAQKVVVVL